jgi:transmembrane sensor
MTGKDAQDRYQELARKWLNKTITSAEEEEFAKWYKSNQDAPVDIPAAFVESEKTHRERILHKINEAIKYDNRPINKIRNIRWISIAAACILSLSIPGLYFHLRNKKVKSLLLTHQKAQIKNDISPGGNKALLTLSNGKKIVLNDVKRGVLVNQGQTLLNKVKDDQIVYEASPGQTNSSTETYNTISTPKGGQFQVVLSDGSKVWLNAASSITFPTIFSKIERKVTITGEVYFEITKNKLLPFKVIAGKQTVEVLGTHFNINAYTDESMIKTTLVEGSVKVSAGKNIAILKPEQQANIPNNGSDEIGVNTADTESILAWKNGSFQFEKAEIPFIMRQLARWYNVTVKYEGSVSQRHFTGSISRNVNLSELLKMLKYTGIDFKIEGQTIIVTS